MDFAVIPADFDTVEQALETVDALGGESGDPPAAVDDLMAELDQTGAAEDDGFLSLWPIDGSTSGAVLCTRWPQWDRTIYTLLKMTKPRGLALVDLQQRQVFDPRGSVDVAVSIANGTKLPHLSEQIVADVMARQSYYGDYLIIERAYDDYAQSLYKHGEPCQVEYRDGSPERHFQTLTIDRDLVPRPLWAWVQFGPDAELLREQRWQRLAF